jgi:hypothetical protein
MKDVTTQKPLYVSTEGNAGPYIMVPEEQLEQVRRLLDEREVSYWVDENVISLDGKPAIAVINLGLRGNAQAIQEILDATP